MTPIQIVKSKQPANQNIEPHVVLIADMCRTLIDDMRETVKTPGVESMGAVEFVKMYTASLELAMLAEFPESFGGA